MNVILQPVHLLLYMALIGDASDLVVKNPIYALVAIGFLIPAEKFVKNMFGLNKASSTSDFGTFAGTALAYEGLKKLGSAIPGKKGVKPIKGGDAGSNETEEAKFNKVRRSELGSYASNNGENADGEGNKEANRPRFDDENMKELSEEQRKQLELNKIREEKEALGQELDQYQKGGGDVYSADPETQAKQLRYNELEAQQRAIEEQQREEARDGAREKSREKFEIPQGNKLMQSAYPERRKGSKRRIANRVAKTVGRRALKGTLKGLNVASRAALAVGGGTIGLAAGIGSGDLRNAIGYATAGAAVGGKIGGSIGNQIENLPNTIKSGAKAISDGYDKSVGKVIDAYNEETYGSKFAKDKRTERLNSRARKEFLRDKDQQKKYSEMKRDIGYDGDVKSLMNAVADYKEAGVNDDMIKNALKVEQKRDGTVGGTNHSKMIDVASFATDNGYKKSDILGKKSRSDMEDVVEATVGSKDRYDVMKNIADLYDAGDFYSKNSRFKKASTTKAMAPTSNVNANGGTTKTTRGRTSGATRRNNNNK